MPVAVGCRARSRRPSGKRQNRADACPVPGRALDAERAAQRLGAVAEAEETPPCGVGAARPVVGHLNGQRAPVARDRHRRAGRSRVLRSIRERLRDDVVSGGLDLFGKAVFEDWRTSREPGGARSTPRRAVAARRRGGSARAASALRRGPTRTARSMGGSPEHCKHGSDRARSVASSCSPPSHPRELRGLPL
jgi:hypothetical protein